MSIGKGKIRRDEFLITLYESSKGSSIKNTREICQKIGVDFDNEGSLIGRELKNAGLIDWEDFNHVSLTTKGAIEARRLKESDTKTDTKDEINPLKLWLETIYKKELSEENTSERALSFELSDRLPKDFNPSNFKGAFWRVHENIPKLTIIGIGFIAPEGELVKRADAVFQGILGKLKVAPNVKTISIQDVSGLTNLQDEEIAEIFEYFIALGYFYKSGKNTSTIKMDDKTFNNFKRIKTVQQLVNENLNIKLQNNSITPEKQPNIKKVQKPKVQKPKPPIQNIPKSNQFRNHPDFIDSLIILLVSTALIIFIIWIASQILDLKTFTALPDFIVNAFSSIWTSIATGATGVGLAVYKSFTRNKNGTHPNYLMWVLKVTLSILGLISIMIFILKSVTPIKNSNKDADLNTNSSLNSTNYNTNTNLGNPPQDKSSSNKINNNSGLIKKINPKLSSKKVTNQNKKTPEFRNCDETGDCPK